MSRRNDSLHVGFLSASISRRSGGLYNSARRLAQTLQADRRCKVSVFSRLDPCSGADADSWSPIEPRLYPVYGPPAIGWAPQMMRALGGAQLDLLHVQHLWLFPSRLCLRWHDETRRPYVVSARGMLEPWALRRSHWKKRLARLLFENDHLRGASCLHALNREEARSMRKAGLTGPLCVIPNGVDTVLAAPPGRPPWDESWVAQRRVLLYLGRIHPKKGLRDLLRAFGECRRHGPRGAVDWVLVVAGWGEPGHVRRLREDIHSLDLGDCVLFAGEFYDKAKSSAFGRAEAFVLPSYSEGLPMTVLEASAHGLPAVLSEECHLSSLGEVAAAIEVPCGFLGVRRGLQRLFAMQEDERRAMGARARAVVVRDFAWERVAAEMRRVYDWILGGGELPACVEVRIE